MNPLSDLAWECVCVHAGVCLLCMQQQREGCWSEGAADWLHGEPEWTAAQVGLSV